MFRYKEILLVDDEPAVLKALTREFKPHFSVVHCASSGLEALTILERHPIEIVISDYRMPNMDGTELVVNIRNKYPHVVTIILSGQADIKGLSRALNEGKLHRFLQKPWDREELIETIRLSLLEREALLGSDVLTNLKNRRTLDEQIIELKKHGDSSYALVMVNIANLDEINHQYGGALGNQFIKTLAWHLSDGNTEPETIYRYKDKLFMCIPYSPKGYQVVMRLCSRLSQPVEVDTHLIKTRYTVLLCDVKSLHQVDDISIADLNERSRVRLHHQLPIYWLDNDPQSRELLALFSVLNDIDRRYFCAFYQPQLSTVTGDVCGFEALARRKTVENEWQYPASFLPIIEQYGLTTVLTEKILEDVLMFIKQHQKLIKDRNISVNVPGNMLINGQFYELLTKLTTKLSCGLNNLSIEITEHDFIEDFIQAKQELSKLKGLGLSCALDDFGTGYAGYEYLCEMPFDVLKIDGRFVQAIGKSASNEVILRAMIDSAESLEMGVIAEWVDTQEQADKLKTLGCSIIQGHLVSQALSSDDVVSYLSRMEEERWKMSHKK
ncbi:MULTISPECIES: EAL domain-containing protein [Vibrio]|uniref:EAL domain-containing protein n=1 Tax=Vibrio TaxID=662 RepID=UPI0002D27ECC|nr:MULTISPECIES: EAL domain-containing protein [Vibrio]NNN47524.1 EAL domain-containing protein [Vibrio sp. 2-2(8)]OEE40851.1 diguanylate cyclase [Vibrio anguillarum]